MISVIISEYENRGFLKYALSSVFNQTLSRDEYEILVSKRFEDKELDNYARKNGARVIYDYARKVGEQVYNATQEAKGDILTFLDDDDMYREDRLATIKKIFSSRNIAGFRNQIIKIDVKGNILDPYKAQVSNDKSEMILNSKNFRAKIHNFPLFNNSTFAIRRDALQDDIKGIEISLDTYLLYEAICNQTYEGLYIDPNPLTYYRVHVGNVSISRSPLYFSRLFNDYKIIYNKHKNCSKHIELSVKKRMVIGKRILYESEILHGETSNISFSLDEIVFLINPFNKSSFKHSLLSLPAGFVLMLPKRVRDKVVKLYVKKYGLI